MGSHVLIADLTTVAIPVSILILSTATLIYNAVSGKRQTMSGLEASLNNRLTDLVRQVDELKEELHECTRQRASLERENIALMRQVMNLRNGDSS